MMREGRCPSCGGPIELKLGSSHALVCPWCRFSVVRTDRDLRAVGKVADLIPTSPDFAVGDILALDGVEAVVGGRLQLDQGQGPWDEYYVEVAQKRWGWLAKAQGLWMLTHPLETAGPLPPYEQLAPGQQGTLPGLEERWTVQERGVSRLLSAEGELPFAIQPEEQGRFVDLAAPGGMLATIDYGDGSSAPRLYVGRTLARAEVVSEAMGARPAEQVQLGKLACPSCGAPIELLAPEITESTGCASCGAVLDLEQGSLRFISAQARRGARPLIPFGTEGTLFGERVVCIGFMERTTSADGSTYAWREYLLYCPSPGEGARSQSRYRWLMEDNGHWIYIWPVSGADVEAGSMFCKLRGRPHRLFSTARGSVATVLGEFYWKVRAGQQADLVDYTRPPHIVSQESTAGADGRGEVTWSAGEHIEPEAVWKGFGLAEAPPRREGVGVVQPNPTKLGWAFGTATLLLSGFCLLAGIMDVLPSGTVVMSETMPVPPAPTTQPDPSGQFARFSSPFEVKRTTTMRVSLDTNADNQYIGVVGALVNQETGEVAEFYVDTGYYHGVSGGESWTEGDRDERSYVSGIRPGRYVLRADPYWQRFPQPGAFTSSSAPRVTIEARMGKRSGWTLFLVALLLVLPLILAFFRHAEFEKKRNENSNVLS